MTRAGEPLSIAETKVQRRSIITGDEAFRLGTLAEVIGEEEADDFFNEPNPSEEARKAAFIALSEELGERPLCLDN